MPKFKKNPIIVEAEQYLEGEKLPPGVTLADDDTPSVHTPNGHVEIEDRDWIIKDVKDGFYYPCKPEIFDELFEEVIDSEVQEKDTKESFPTEQRCPVCNNGNFLLTNRKYQKWCPTCGHGKAKK